MPNEGNEDIFGKNHDIFGKKGQHFLRNRSTTNTFMMFMTSSVNVFFFCVDHDQVQTLDNIYDGIANGHL